VPFDARIFSATHRDLEADVRERRFRQDLFYRINVVCIDVPPLRERVGDTLKLGAYFLDKFCRQADRPHVSLSPQVAERLLAYEWPGNVRELENCMERVAALARFDQAMPEDLPESIRASRTDGLVVSAGQSEEIVKIDELERRYILRVLKIVEGNKSRAAQLLGLDRRTLYRKLDQYRQAEAGRVSQVTELAPQRQVDETAQTASYASA